MQCQEQLELSELPANADARDADADVVDLPSPDITGSCLKVLIGEGNLQNVKNC